MSVNCPYCEADIEINHDDGSGYSEDELHTQECPKCEKSFAFYTSIHFSYSVRKADCLNDGNHNYERTKTYPPEFAVMRCVMCGDEKPLPENKP